MEKFIPGLDIEAENKRINLGAWMFDDTSICECSSCSEYNYYKPTPYCPMCGALMLNFKAAEQHYETYMRKLINKCTIDIDAQTHTQNGVDSVENGGGE